jgi:hypothetical protein
MLVTQRARWLQLEFMIEIPIMVALPNAAERQRDCNAVYDAIDGQPYG